MVNLTHSCIRNISFYLFIFFHGAIFETKLVLSSVKMYRINTYYAFILMWGLTESCDVRKVKSVARKENERHWMLSLGSTCMTQPYDSFHSTDVRWSLIHCYDFSRSWFVFVYRIHDFIYLSVQCRFLFLFIFLFRRYLGKVGSAFAAAEAFFFHLSMYMHSKIKR